MKVVRDAIERASHGDGPTMIEALTSRILANGKDRTVGRDPIERVRQYLQAKGVWDSADQKDLEAETNAELDEAIANAESAPAPPLESMFTDVYEGMPPHLRAQFEASRANKKSK
jgi:pyruvate dehydrogenase E1 component alpha subunit